MPTFAQFTPPEAATGDRYVPKENVGHVIVVKPGEVKHGIVTEFSPDGTDAIECQIVDLDRDGGTVYRDALVFGGAFVDGFTKYAGQLTVVRLEKRKGNTGRSYMAPAAATPAEIQRAEQYFATHPDPFAPQFQTVDDDPPF